MCFYHLGTGRVSAFVDGFRVWINLVPRFSLLPIERLWLGLVTCLPEFGRLQTNDMGEGWISVRFVSAKRRRRGQWKLCIRPCLKGPGFIVPGLVKTKPRMPNPLTAKA